MVPRLVDFDRRSVLRVLASVVSWLALGSADHAGAWSSASPGYRGCAATGLGHKLQTEHPMEADRLRARGLTALHRLDGGDMQSARRRLLDPDRLASEIDCDEVLLVDGWTIARSEAEWLLLLDS